MCIAIAILIYETSPDFPNRPFDGLTGRLPPGLPDVLHVIPQQGVETYGT